MHDRVINVEGRLEIDPVAHDRALLLVKKNTKIILPPLASAGVITFKIYPVGKAKATLHAPDDGSLISTGAPPTTKVVLSGQNVFAVVAAEHWLIFGSSGVSHGEIPPATDETDEESPGAETESKVVSED